MSAVATDPAALYTLELADDCLVLSHRLAQWSSKAHTLEEDVELTNIALDLLGQARALYARTADLDGSGRSEDDYVYLRDERAFRNCLLVEHENGDFAVRMARQLLYSAYQLPLWRALTVSSDGGLAAIAAKAVKETTYHLDHARQWVVRLGDGTDESHSRMQAGLDALWPFTFELFERYDDVESLVVRNVAADPATLRRGWNATIDTVIHEATLVHPETSWRPSGGRRGVHTEVFGYMIAEMQHLHRSHPGARW
ncbi:MAG: 1,2-phenylacetyl-CoA epoxidase subunit PaaC [Candidatus Dormibacteria bacterium]